MARFGLLTLHRGKWNGKQLLSEQWIQESVTPTTAKTDYGYMNWFLNTDKKLLPAAPASAFMHVGNGNNLVYVDPEHELVVVIRWIADMKSMDATVKKIIEAINR
jgi:CubicO group peptidase (beta-lactamase class C family)